MHWYLGRGADAEGRGGEGVVLVVAGPGSAGAMVTIAGGVDEELPQPSTAIATSSTIVRRRIAASLLAHAP